MRNLPPGAKSLGIKLPPGVTPPKPGRRGGRATSQRGVANSTERAYAQHLEERRLAGEIDDFAFQSEKLLISRTEEIGPDGKIMVRSQLFEPDFRVIMPDGTVEFHDVKGRSKDKPWIESDAQNKIRSAASLHPYVFRIVWPRKGGGWDQITVNGREGVA